MKFGGSSVGDLQGLKHVLGIIRGEQNTYRTVVIVSATSGTTDRLVALSSAPETGEGIAALRARHATLASDLLGDGAYAAYLKELDQALDALRKSLAGSDAGRTDAVLATGERLSAPLVALALERLGVKARAVDACDFIHTDDAFGEAVVDRRATRRAIASWFRKFPADVVPVVTGFIGRSACGRTTVLGRGGSDYTAALVADGVGATKLDRWTDVDGLYTADPRRVDGAGRFLFLLLEDASTWNEASQLGMHRHAFDPVRRAGIPVHVRSTRYPQGDGTLILPRRLAGRVRESSRRAMKHADPPARGGEARSDP